MTQMKGLPPFHHSTGRPFHSSTHTHLQIFSWEHIQMFPHFISSHDPPPESPSAPSSIGLNTEYGYICVNVYIWFHHTLRDQQLWCSQKVQRDLLPYKTACNSYWELAKVTRGIGLQEEEGLFGTGVHMSGMVSKRDHCPIPPLFSKALWPERA